MKNGVLLVSICFLWGFLHSFLASHKTKLIIKNYFGSYFDRYYRIIYNIIAFISILPILGMMFFFKDIKFYTVKFPWSLLLIVLQLFVLIIFIVASKQTGVTDLVGIKKSSSSIGIEEKTLKTSGLYRYVRHPIYSAGLVFLWCSSVLTLNYLIVVICMTLYIIIGAELEERKLLIEFGDLYSMYKKDVPMFIPGLHWNNIPFATSKNKKIH